MVDLFGIGWRGCCWLVVGAGAEKLVTTRHRTALRCFTMDPILLLPSETSRLPGAEILDFNENDDFEQDTALSIDCDFFDDLFEDALERETQIADNIVSMNVDKVKYTYTDYDLLDDLEEKSKVVPRNVQLETSGDCGEELDQDVTLGFEDDLFEDDRRYGLPCRSYGALTVNACEAR